MGNTDHFWRVPRVNRWAVVVGPGTSGTLLSDLHTSAVAQLVGEGRVHHCRLHTCACVALHRELGWMENLSDTFNDCGSSAGDSDCRLHSLSFRTGKSARYVAKPATATA